jgi:hypothetical protein
MIAGVSGGMKVSEGKHDLIKNDILRNIDSPCGDIKALKPLRLVMKQIDPSEFTIIIDKADIILFPTKGING